MSTKAPSSKASRQPANVIPANAGTNAERPVLRRGERTGVRRDVGSGGGGGGGGGVWRVPLLLGVLTAFGLVAALFGDGPWDAASALALASPLAVAAWHIVRSSRRG